jgi:hypothetical protein
MLILLDVLIPPVVRHQALQVLTVMAMAMLVVRNLPQLSTPTLIEAHY